MKMKRHPVWGRFWRTLLLIALVAAVGIMAVPVQNVHADEPPPKNAVDWVGLMWPRGGKAHYVPENSADEDIIVYVQVYEPGVTPFPGQGVGIECYLHWGEFNEGGEDLPMEYNVDIGNNDEYMVTLTQDMLNGLEDGIYGFIPRCRMTVSPDEWTWKQDSVGDQDDGLITIVPKDDPEPAPPGGVFVHLFEWSWDDIRKECPYLAEKGYAAVQVSPPEEHAVVEDSPWYERYQPVTYDLISRSGDRDEFIEMVDACNEVGVDIYVDAVINHMTWVGSGIGYGGSTYGLYDYPDYDPVHFHDCGLNQNNDISDYTNRWEVQNCELLNLADLFTGYSFERYFDPDDEQNGEDPYVEYVRNEIAAYLQDLVDIGVAGFRIDASKHMAAQDIEAILGRVNGDFYVFQEVIAANLEPIRPFEYFPNGDVTEFKYSTKIAGVFKHGYLSWLGMFGEAWGMMDSRFAVTFTDNHDNQRGHGGAGDPLTYKDGVLYDLANVFMLSWPYGYPKVMSSYDFEDPNAGPPSVPVHNPNGTLNCFGDDWICEHRWRPIANMVEFRNVTAGEPVVEWWDNHGDQIAFGRGDRGFVVINKEWTTLSRAFETDLPGGIYCNVIDGQLNPDGESCSGSQIGVYQNGQAVITIPPLTAVAIHVGDMYPGDVNPPTTFSVKGVPEDLDGDVYLVGDAPELGKGDPCRAIPLARAEESKNWAHDPGCGVGVWSVPVVLPSSTAIEYKYVTFTDCAKPTWEKGRNRILKTPAKGATDIWDAWR